MLAATASRNNVSVSMVHSRHGLSASMRPPNQTAASSARGAPEGVGCCVQFRTAVKRKPVTRPRLFLLFPRLVARHGLARDA